jgi:FtsH-binding integral membrane protein
MTNLKRLRIAMVLGCLLAVGAGVAYYLKSSGYGTSDSSSAGWWMLMVAGAVSVLAATSRRRRKQGEKDEKANKTNS